MRANVLEISGNETNRCELESLRARELESAVRRTAGASIHSPTRLRVNPRKRIRRGPLNAAGLAVRFRFGPKKPPSSYGATMEISAMLTSGSSAVSPVGKPFSERM